MREKDYKELTHASLEADKSQDLPSAGWNQCFILSLKAGKKHCHSSKAIRQEELLLHRRVSHFVLFRSSTGWMRPTRIREDNLLYSAYQLKCQLHPETPSHTPRVKFDQISGHSVTRSNWPKINHHNLSSLGFWVWVKGRQSCTYSP